MLVQTPLEQILFSTVRITTSSAAGSGLGTGFLYTQPMPAGGDGLVLVTNKHVVDGADTATLHFIAQAPDGAPSLGHEVTFTVPASEFIGHPDPDIDISALPVAGLLAQLASAGTPAFLKYVSSELVATSSSLEAFEPIEPVILIGYPDGLYDTASLLPIARRGHSATPLAVDYEGKPTFLIDASVFPGSSGSPVFLWSSPSMPNKHGTITLGSGGTLLFLGVVAAVYQREVPVLTSGGASPFVHDAIDIGIVYKASTVFDLVSQMIASIK